MHIAVIGTGNVGGTLGRRWAKAGQDVTFGARDPAAAKVKALVQEVGPKATAAAVPEAVRRAEVVVLAVPWDGAQDAVRASLQAGVRSVEGLTQTVSRALERPRRCRGGRSSASLQSGRA